MRTVFFAGPAAEGAPVRPREARLSTADLRRELAAEQTYLDRLYRQLDRLRDRSARDLDQVRRAPLVPTPAGRAERDAFDAWHSERLRQLRAVEERLCFGRLDLIDGDRRYVGRIGLSDEDQAQLLLDWRAPAAAAFYQATAAAPDGVVRRRHLATRGRKVTGLDDEVLDPAALAERNELATVAGEGALMTALMAHRTGQMRDIVATLQAEQDHIVRAPLPGVLVVQGGPGTGKTAVALHRAAYLLYTHRQRIARSGVLIVGPTPVFLRYIEQVLPSLGESGVVLAAIGELYPGVVATSADPAEAALVKGDLRMARVLRNAVRLRQRLIDRPVKLTLDGDPLVLRPRMVAGARGRARSTGRPHNEARVTFATLLLEELARQLAERRRVDPEDDGTQAELLTELRASRDVRREINLRWMPLTPEKVLTDLLANPARLAAAADGLLTRAEQRALLREPGAPWTMGDVPLLDELAELIGPDVASSSADSARAAAVARAEALAYAQGVLELAPSEGPKVTAEMLADRWAADSGQQHTLAERAIADRSWTYGHAVVDEAQELSPMQWRMLFRRVPSKSMTVVGDVAQTGAAAGTADWAAALEPHAADRWRLAELTINYRTPGRIMDLAASMLRAAGQPVAPPRTAREGDWPPIEATAAPDELVRSALGAVQDDDAALGGGRFAIIVPRSAGELADALGKAVVAELPGDLAERTSVHQVDEVKGLEFDGVVVVDPDRIAAGSARGPNDRYVAMTRPTQRLTLLRPA